MRETIEGEETKRGEKKKKGNERETERGRERQTERQTARVRQRETESERQTDRHRWGRDEGIRSKALDSLFSVHAHTPRPAAFCCYRGLHNSPRTR